MIKEPTIIKRDPEEELDDLEASIRRHGQLQPVVTTADGTVIVGDRRRLVLGDAADVIVLDVDKIEAVQMRLSEELSHRPIDAIARAKAIDDLRRMLEKQGEPVTDAALAKRLGVTRSAIVYYRQLYSLPAPVRKLVSSGKINVGAAKVLSRDQGKMKPDEVEAVARKVAAGTLPNQQDELHRVIDDAVKRPAKERSAILRNPKVTAESMRQRDERVADRERARAEETADPALLIFLTMTRKVREYRKAIELVTDGATLCPPKLRKNLRVEMTGLCSAIDDFLAEMDTGEGTWTKGDAPTIPPELSD